MKGVFVVVVFILVMGLFTFAQSNLERAKRELTRLRDELADANKKSDILFLLDTSGSLSFNEFQTEKGFVRSFLNTITVSFHATRIEVIPFADTASRYIDGVSVPSLDKHKCSLVEKFNSMPQNINGFGRNTYGAFKLAFDICLGQLSAMKRVPLYLVKTVVVLLTVGPWQGQSPVSIAKNIQQGNVEVFVIGVGNRILENNLQNMVNNADKQAFYFGTFQELAELSVSLRGDPFGTRSQNVDPRKCNSQCDPTASCVCHLTYATYQCLCANGYGGSGLVGQCKACPHNTYNDGSTIYCKPCPANSGHSLTGSRSVLDCKCFKGYEGRPESGNPCTVRSCEQLLPPSNGAFIGVCNSKYNSVCRIKCNEGYEVSGSAERKCIVADGPNIMVWSGKPFQCQVIRCPLLYVPNADPPTGICSNPELSYHSYCSFKCSLGYQLKGSEVRVCQLDKTWSGASTTCEETRCPKLPTVRYATVTPPECVTQPMRFYSSCRFDCPDGYFTEVTGPVDSRVLTCQLNGAWDAGVPRCHDHQPPTLTCPQALLTAETTKEKATGKVSWKIHVTDNSVIVNPNAKINVTSSHQPSQELPIGVTEVFVTASDCAGNVASCRFRVDIRDTEPPTFSQCPGDIVREEKNIHARVNWAEPVFSDNSGQVVSAVSNIQSGASLSVPGVYYVVYTASDGSNNKNENCTFKITLKKKQCTPFTPPRNGALVCATKSNTCAVMCRTGTDFESNPPFLYYCSSGVWKFFSLFHPFKPGTPGPNCAVGVNSQMKIFPHFYFDGDAPNVQDTIKDNFYQLLMSPFVPPLFCKDSPHLCLKNDMSVSLGVKG